MNRKYFVVKCETTHKFNLGTIFRKYLLDKLKTFCLIDDVLNM